MKPVPEREEIVEPRQFVRPTQAARPILVIPIISIEPVGPVLTKTLPSGFRQTFPARGSYANSLWKKALVSPRGFHRVLLRDRAHAVRLYDDIVRLRPQRLQGRSQLPAPERAGDLGLDRQECLDRQERPTSARRR